MKTEEKMSDKEAQLRKRLAELDKEKLDVALAISAELGEPLRIDKHNAEALSKNIGLIAEGIAVVVDDDADAKQPPLKANEVSSQDHEGLKKNFEKIRTGEVIVVSRTGSGTGHH
jgi:hypothetical protein